MVKRLLFIAISGLLSLTVVAQKDVPKGWHLLNPKDSGNYSGISLGQAYDFIKTKKLKSSTVLVAVIDSGVDTTHEDLKSVLWHNPKEIPGNGIDDDKNGYVDDVYGWNFLGGRDGRSVEKDSYEAARVYHGLKDKWGTKDVDKSKLSADDRREYEMWLRAKAEVASVDPDEVRTTIKVKNFLKDAKAGDSTFKATIKEKYTGKDVDAYTPETDVTKKAKRGLMSLYHGFGFEQDTPAEEVMNDAGEYVSNEESKAEAAEKAPPSFRDDIVKDNYNDFNDRFYGNSDVMVSRNAALHGTHVSGIIAAARGNGVGIEGVANDVKIMMVRAVPDGMSMIKTLH
jgi:subtilisin family serine protease